MLWLESERNKKKGWGFCKRDQPCIPIVRGKYAARYASGTNIVPIDPDLQDVFRRAVGEPGTAGHCPSCPVPAENEIRRIGFIVNEKEAVMHASRILVCLAWRCSWAAWRWRRRRRSADLAAQAADGGRKPLMQALKDRQTSRSFSSEKLPEQMLSNLLWAADGVNRADGKRTAPTAMNRQEIDVYVATADGLYLLRREGQRASAGGGEGHSGLDREAAVREGRAGVPGVCGGLCPAWATAPRPTRPSIRRRTRVSSARTSTCSALPKGWRPASAR